MTAPAPLLRSILSAILLVSSGAMPASAGCARCQREAQREAQTLAQAWAQTGAQLVAPQTMDGWRLPESVPSVGPLPAERRAHRQPVRRSHAPAARRSAASAKPGHHAAANPALAPVSAPAPNRPAPVANASANPEAARAATIPAIDPAYLALLRSLMAAIDQANRSGNYSGLVSLGTSRFRESVTDEQLAQMFKAMRDQKVNFLATLVTEPVMTIFSGDIAAEKAVRLTGSFPMQPLPIEFDVTYLSESGAWSLAELNVALGH
ncbi:hypothetical protein [Rhizobium sp. SSA_523]|uniref:hypothetical protein n=1 Tax=Rhizobium sp. SSA_523 TaxID=2952477 RepID=UPI0020915312|nr:hypothetical protein [Rhizobium sp. SSA_523]MCO5730499.1 hypothetical protein [Rhizobium sp. SSA_523]WKC25538.1 hypothetical protein QTJ18_16390 [Rhizobium sp. SSA_523]